MSTRSITYFYENGVPFAAFYCHSDGYPEGHGVELGKILANIRLVNGLRLDDKAGKAANGPGCLAAQIVATLKNESGIGGIYLVNPNPESNKYSYQEFEYHVFIDTVVEGSEITYVSCIECRDPERVIFSGDFKSFYKWAQNPEKDDECENFTTGY